MNNQEQEKVEKFKAERLKEIAANITPIPLNPSGKIILHIIPVNAFALGNQTNIIKNANSDTKLSPMNATGWSRRINFDGVLLFSSEVNGLHGSYLTFYRSGIIESVDSDMLSYSDDKGKKIPEYDYEKAVKDMVVKCVSFLKENKVEIPMMIYLTLTGVKDYFIDIGTYSSRMSKIDRDCLELPGHLMQNYDEDVSDILRPMFDIVCNSGGFLNSNNFDEHGKFRP